MLTLELHVNMKPNQPPEHFLFSFKFCFEKTTIHKKYCNSFTGDTDKRLYINLTASKQIGDM